MKKTEEPPTPVQGKRIKKAVEIIENPVKEISYQHTVLCQTSLPYRDPGDDVREWERTQGRVILSLEAGKALNLRTRQYEKVGLPYGAKPRLLLAYLNAEALKTGTPEIYVEDSLTAFIRRLQGYPPNGQELVRFKEQLTRFSVATVRMAVDVSPTRAYQVDTKIVAAFELWDRGGQQRVLWPSSVRLSLDYFESLAKHAVPLDERAMAALSNSPMALDVYAWLAQRLHRVDPAKPQFITWKAIYDQFGHGYARIRDFRAAFLGVLGIVHAQYRGADIAADGKGLTLYHSAPPIAGRYTVVKRRNPGIK